MRTNSGTQMRHFDRNREGRPSIVALTQWTLIMREKVILRCTSKSWISRQDTLTTVKLRSGDVLVSATPQEKVLCKERLRKTTAMR